MKLNELTIAEAGKGIQKKEFSTAELVSDCLKTIREKDNAIHAYLRVDEGALDHAKKIDALLAKMSGEERASLPALYGIPLAVKDNILVRGTICTAGSKILENYRAPYSATVIEKLNEQGAIILGKTNLDEFAMGSSTENSAFGPTKNPHDASRVPGGSSGGSAASTAAHMCIAALGSDTGGSIRQPASFCGIVGAKPSYGAVSRHGLIAMASSLDQIGPLAKTVEDARILFEAIRGKDHFDATTYNGSQKPRAKSQELKEVKIGVPKEYFGKGLDPAVERLIKNAIKKCEDAGAEIRETTLPHAEYALPAYYIIVPSEVSANLARFDGIRYGHTAGGRRQAQNLYDTYAQSRAEGFGTEAKRRIMLGAYTLSAGYHDAYYVKAQKVRRLIAEDFEKAFASVDVILGPTTPAPAFPLGARTENPLEMYLADIYTVAVNLAGLPALSIPAGNISRLPIGLQLIGDRAGEEALFSIGKNVESVIKNT